MGSNISNIERKADGESKHFMMKLHLLILQRLKNAKKKLNRERKTKITGLTVTFSDYFTLVFV